MSLGKYQVAQQILDDHKVDIETYFPPEHPAGCSVINNQAMLHKLNGKPDLALAMFESVYETYKVIYGQHHGSTVNTLVNVATTYRDLGENQKAVDLMELAIEGRRVTEGENSVNYAMVKSMAAAAYRELG